MYRYRKLVARLDWTSIWDVWSAGAGYARNSNYNWNAARDYQGSADLPIVSAPRRVEASEGEGSFEELSEMIRTGRLRPEDLVEWEGAWTSFDRVYHFDDVCEVAQRRRRGRDYARAIAAMVFFPIAAALAVAGLVWLMIWMDR